MAESPVASNLFGRFHVTPTYTALREARQLFPRYGDYQELRRHALKLAFWPGGTTVGGQVEDLNWDTITGMKPPKACELRIDDVIGGFDNLRLIFYVFDEKLIRRGDVLPRLWILRVMQKKTQRFTNNDLKIFAARVAIVRQRQYEAY